MQIFIDTQSNEQYHFDDNVLVENSGGTYSFFDADGNPLSVPSTLQPYVETSAEKVTKAANDKQVELAQAYSAAAYPDIQFTTSGGVTAMFQADPVSLLNIKNVLTANPTQADLDTNMPGLYWVAADNSKPAFTRSDLQGLAAAIAARGWPAFDNLQTKKAQVRSIEADTSLTDADKITQIQAVTF